MRGSELTSINAPAVAVAITVAVRGRYQFSLSCLFSIQLCPKQKSPQSVEVRVVMTHEHMFRTLGRVKGFVFPVAASVQLVLLAFAFALTGTAA